MPKISGFSGLFTRLQTACNPLFYNGFRPLFQCRFRYACCKAFSLSQISSRAGVFQLFIGVSHAASAGRRQCHHLLARQVILLQECIDDGRRYIPPDREVKCSQFPSCVDFTGFNCIQNCVYCYYLSFFSKIALKHRPHYFHI